ncbi:uncharacterized protein VTP21DRAFT_10407 [Calcarisporiella thermophila]|uniref:uncharacterized protein n=1 Tax=Calcarisporiella thermophila TaxID=911321 RepID=UPI0037449164
MILCFSFPFNSSSPFSNSLTTIAFLAPHVPAPAEIFHPKRPKPPPPPPSALSSKVGPKLGEGEAWSASAFGSNTDRRCSERGKKTKLTLNT